MMAERIGTWLLSGVAAGSVLGFGAHYLGLSEVAAVAVGVGTLLAFVGLALVLPHVE